MILNSKLCGISAGIRHKGGDKCAVSIAGTHKRHVLFFVTTLHSLITAKVIQGSMQQLDYNLLYENNVS